MDIPPEQFEQIVADIGFNAVPEQFRPLIKNVALVIEDEPNDEVRKEFGLQKGETLLGLYTGVPRTVRGSDYGVGATMPDCIVLYRLPILEAAEADKLSVQKVVADTIWHEVAHYFGMDEHQVRNREKQRMDDSPKQDKQ
jgi:predicted Zn-dependent protease with MMP-like domain